MTSVPELQAINTNAAPEPVGPYNQAVLAGGLLFCSGQIALDPTSGQMVGDGDVEAETGQVSLRSRRDGDLGSVALSDLVAAGARANQDRSAGLPLG